MTDDLTIVEYDAKRKDTICPVKYADCKVTSDGKLELRLTNTCRSDYGGREILLLTVSALKPENGTNWQISCHSLNGKAFKLVKGKLSHNHRGSCEILSFTKSDA